MCAACVFLAAARAAEAAPTGVVAAYAFDEGSGSIAEDASGASHRGQISNVTWTAAGKIRRSRRLRWLEFRHLGSERT